MNTPVPLCRIWVDMMLQADILEGNCPTLNFFDQFSVGPHPDGWDSSAEPVELLKAFRDSEVYHLKSRHLVPPKLMTAYAASLLRDSHYSRMGRKALRQNGRRSKMRRLVRQAAATSRTFQGIDFEALQENLSSAPPEAIKPNLESL